MARLCVLMSVFAFGLSFAPSILNSAKGTAAPVAVDTKTPSSADCFRACSAECSVCALDAHLYGSVECARLCEKCEHFCAVCADLTAAQCGELKKITAGHLAACIEACQKSDREPCQKCVAACQVCLELCRAAD